MPIFLLPLLLAACSPSPSPTPGTVSSPAAELPSPEVPAIDEAKVASLLAELASADQAAKAEALKVFPRADLDEVKGLKFRSPKDAPKYVNTRTSVHAEVTTKMDDTVKAVFVQFSYVADDWLFFDKATIAAGDFRATVDFERPSRENAAGKVWEWDSLLIVDNPTPELWAVVGGKAIPASTAEKMSDPNTKVIVRFEGREYYKDYVLKPWEKASIAAAVVLAKDPPDRDDALAAIQAREQPNATASAP